MKLEIRISATTVRTILLRHGLDPAPRRAVERRDVLGGLIHEYRWAT
jgi:hypothetical protein